MKTLLRQTTTLAQCIALLLAVRPAVSNGGNKNVYIFDPVSDQAGLAYYRLPICIYPDFWVAAQQWDDLGNAWAWNNAVIDEGGTDELGSTASTDPEFEGPGTWTVQAIYGGMSSYGVQVTVVCPNEATYAGDPICYVPTMQGNDTNYAWGGTFHYTYTYLSQYGTLLYAGGLFWKENEPVRLGGSDCDVLPGFTWTKTPFQLDSNAAVEDIVQSASSSPPSAQCVDNVSVVALLGVTYDGPWSCPYTNFHTVAVTVEGEESTVTATDNGTNDPPCNFEF